MPRSQKQRIDGVNSEYPADWPAIASRIKAAAGGRCVRCGHPDEPPWKIQKMVPWWKSRSGREQTGPSPCDELCTHPPDGKQRMLTVHHLDMDKANVADWNLAALCQGCHLSVQGRVDFHQEYLFEHTPWMRPYVEGFKRARSMEVAG